MLDAEGAAVLADGFGDVAAVPPQAVRLSRAAAATPVAVKVVRLNDCISVLLVSADSMARRGAAAAIASSDS